MGLFSKLFSKKEKEPEKKDDDKITFDSPYGKFLYAPTPACDEYGYEADIEWREGDKFPAEVFIETDSPDTTEAGRCYEKFERFMLDKERTDYDVKSYIAEYFLKRPEYIDDDSTKESLMENMTISWIGMFRNGDAQFSVYDHYGIRVDDLDLKFKADGSKEIEYTSGEYENRQKHCEKI